MNVIRLAQTDSTNEQAKKLLKAGAAHGTVVVADTQTAGKGQKGRAFFSPPKSGLYASIVLRDLAPDEAAKLTAVVAVAAARAIESVADVKVSIKWVNDLLIDGKKVAGILTEGQCTAEGTVDAVVGIGINVRQVEFPAELRDIAGTIEDAAGARVDRETLLEALLSEIECADGSDYMAEYRARSSVIGRAVTVTAADRVFEAVAVDIDGDGALIVESGGVRERFIFGEVRVR